DRSRRFFRVPFVEKKLLIVAFIVVTVVRLAASMLPFTRFRAALKALARRRPTRGLLNSPSADRIRWAVDVSSRIVPGRDSCLMRAAAGQVLFAWSGHSTRLCLGVARHPTNELSAHAWLEHRGLVVLGGPEVAPYKVLCAL